MTEGYRDGGSGSVNASTSRAREQKVKYREGSVRYRALAAVREAGPRGLTSQEFGRQDGRAHQSYSSALSVLHKNGHVERLTEERGEHLVYVHRDFLNGRETEEFKGNTEKAYDRAFKAGAKAAFQRVHDEGLVLDQRGQKILSEIEEEFD